MPLLDFARSRYLGAAGLLAGMSVAAALGQTADAIFNADIAAADIASGKDYIVPPMARAVLTHDPDKVAQAIKDGEDLNEPIHGKDGELAGYTPIILATIISAPRIAEQLLKNGADITLLDNFNRSVFWYAALRGDVKVTSVLIGAPPELNQRGGQQGRQRF